MNTSLSATNEASNQKVLGNLAVLDKEASSSASWPKQLAVPEGQLKVHSSPFRGSFPGVLSEALRAAGLGSHVMVAQLLKGGVGQGPKGSVKLCDRLEWIRPAISCCVNVEIAELKDLENEKTYIEAIKEVWEICKERLLQGKINQLVLDEIGLAISLGYLDETDLLSTLEQRPLAMDVILTGPAIPPSVMAIADQVTVLRGGI